MSKMNNELITCPLDTTNLDPCIIEDAFDNNECLEQNGMYLGFVQGHVANIELQNDLHVIRVFQVELQGIVTKRLQEVLDQNDSDKPNEEYRHIVKNTGGGYIRFYYEKK